MNSSSKLRYLFSSCRPKQWTKNLLCFSAIAITPNTSDSFHKVILATISFILISSTIYLINDLIDIRDDKNHPLKKFRPISSGKVKPREAIILSSLCFITSMYISTLVNFNFSTIILIYTLAQFFYCFKGKNIILVDIYLISFGFVLRGLGGVFALEATPSPWFIITAGLMSLFLAIQKRKSELIRISSSGFSGRNVLKTYTLNYLEKIEILSLSTGFISYLLWASGPIFNGAQSSYMLITCPILLLGINRYQFICDNEKSSYSRGESPTLILFEDKPIKVIVLFLLIACWTITNFF